MDELETSGDVKTDWDRRNARNLVGYDRNGCQMDGAASGARCDSKRVETRPLARTKIGQHERYKRTTANVPRPSTAPTHNYRPLTDRDHRNKTNLVVISQNSIV